MKLLILSFFLLISCSLASQKKNSEELMRSPEMIYSFGQSYNSWSVSGGFGPVFMYADQSGYQIIPNQKIDFGPSLWVTKHLVPAFALELQYLQSNMHGEEGLYGFEGDLLDFSFNGVAIINQMSARPGPLKDRWNYYVKIGVGATMFRSRLLVSNTDEFVQRSQLYGTSSPDYVVLGYEQDDPEKKSAREIEVVLPFGLGVLYRINNSFDVGIESTLRFSASDKLDNILTGSTNDRYLYTAVNLSYKFGEKDRRHMRWTYRGDDMDMFGRTQKNPFEDEVNRLEKNISEYEANRPVHKDSVVIEETLRIVYDQYKVRSIFFPAGRSRNFSPADELQMGRVAIELQNNSKKKVYLYGYSDSQGAADKNLELSRNRCIAVKDFLVSELEVDPGRIEVIPRGEQDLLSPVEELTPRGLQMVNRRVDMIIK